MPLLGLAVLTPLHEEDCAHSKKSRLFLFCTAVLCAPWCSEGANSSVVHCYFHGF
jgi:hypothetical protein